MLRHKSVDEKYVIISIVMATEFFIWGYLANIEFFHNMPVALIGNNVLEGIIMLSFE